MKAILIFNIDGTDINDIHFHAMPILESISGKKFKATSDLILRPLPQKMEESWMETPNDCDYRVGWNDCLDEIENESNIPEWSGNFTRYYVGEWVKYKGITYKTVVNHVSTESLTPDFCPTFFEKIKE